jgi:hypothetical protein
LRTSAVISDAITKTARIAEQIAAILSKKNFFDVFPNL